MKAPIIVRPLTKLTKLRDWQAAKALVPIISTEDVKTKVS